MGNSIIAIAGRAAIAIFIFSCLQTVSANGVISPEEEERIIAEEIAAGRMTEIIPAKRRSTQQLPTSFDRSADKAFPPIGSQRGGSCTGWSTTYYQATYQIAKREGWDAQNGGEEYWASPHWTYNLINGGADNGGSRTNNNEVMIQHGVATWADFPEGDPNRATSWSTDPAVWRKAIKHRMLSKSVIRDVDTPEGIQALKEHIYDEKYGITFSTNSPSSGSHWQWIEILDDPSTPDDDTFIGEEACYYVLENQGGRHALAVIGWNDNIWVDVNKNGSVDPGEKGAFKIPESHGTQRGNDGFYWLAYDALHETSQVVNGPSTGRSPAMLSLRADVVEHRAPYTPKLFAEFTLHTAARIDVVLDFLRADNTATPPFSNPEDSWRGYVFGTMSNNSGNRLGFDGVDYSSSPADAPEGTFVFDLTDIMPTNGQTDVWRFVMKVTDRTSGMPVTVTSFKVIYPGRNDSVFIAQNTPITVDDDVDYVWIDVPIEPTDIVPNPVVSSISGDKAITVDRADNWGIRLQVSAPFTDATHIQVFDLSGRRVWEKQNIHFTPGTHVLLWLQGNAGNIPHKGMYVITFSTSHSYIRRKLLMK